eukprot:gene14545-14674_t
MAVLESFFATTSVEGKAAASSDVASTAAGRGRGYFCMLGKEVLEVGLGWRPPGAAADLRLAAATLQGTEAHVDRSLLTVMTDNKAGLQVMSRDGSWISAPVGPRQMMVMVGHALSWATAGKLPAVVHRVVVGTDDSGVGGSSIGGRLSLAFKLRPAPTAVLDPSVITGLSLAQLPA